MNFSQFCDYFNLLLIYIFIALYTFIRKLCIIMCIIPEHKVQLDRKVSKLDMQRFAEL